MLKPRFLASSFLQPLCANWDGGRIDRLTQNPRGSGAVKLSGMADGYRVRIGDYRVLYQIRDSDKVVLIVKVGHRREVYRR
jgi:mRNA interferase RelE/StbE